MEWSEKRWKWRFGFSRVRGSGLWRCRESGTCVWFDTLPHRRWQLSLFSPRDHGLARKIQQAGVRLFLFYVRFIMCPSVLQRLRCNPDHPPAPQIPSELALTDDQFVLDYFPFSDRRIYDDDPRFGIRNKKRKKGDWNGRGNR